MSTEDQLNLPNSEYTQPRLSIQANIIEKKKTNASNRKENVYFLMHICNYEATSENEAVFYIKGSVP